MLFYKDSCVVYQWEECGLRVGGSEGGSRGLMKAVAGLRESDRGLRERDSSVRDSDRGIRDSDGGFRDNDSGLKENDSGVRLFGNGAFREVIRVR